MDQGSPSFEYRIKHTTEYNYEFPVSLSHHAAHLKPLNLPYQKCISHQLQVSPQPPALKIHQDYFKNSVHYFSIEEKHNQLIVDSESEVSVFERTIPKSGHSPNCAAVIDYLDRLDSPIEAQQYLFPSEATSHSPLIKAFAHTYFRPNYNFLVACSRLAFDIFEEFEFDSTATDVSTPIDQVLEEKKGVCQDFAHLMIACIRSCQLPARYVSGYILTHPPEGQERLIGADATHAWVSVFLPEYGWVDIDPTNAQMCDTDYITVATGRDFKDVSPIKGSVIGGGEQEVSVSVTVTPQSPKSPANVPLVTSDN